MRVWNLAIRVRDSQFTIPAVFIVASLILVFVANRANGSLPDGGLPFLLPSTIPAGRTMLATIAGAIITVAALVFSFTAVTVQLATSQYSPRVIQQFLRDRFQQTVIGVVMGTFTFSLTGLATLGADPSPGSRADWTATFGLVLGVGSAVLIVAYIDHVTRRIDVDDTISRLASATEDAFAGAGHDETNAGLTSWDLPTEVEPHVIRARRQGWVHEIDLADLAEALPPGSLARIDRSTGQYAATGTPLVKVWATHEPTEIDERRAHAAFAIGGPRTIDRDDPGFGIRQLVDIALRALSPGINDPATAADVVRHLVGPIRAAYLQADTRRVFHHDNGTRILVPGLAQPGDHVRSAFSEIRMTARAQPTVLLALAESLAALVETLEAEELDVTAVRQEIGAVERVVDESHFDDMTRAPIVRALQGKGPL